MVGDSLYKPVVLGMIFSSRSRRTEACTRFVHRKKAQESSSVMQNKYLRTFTCVNAAFLIASMRFRQVQVLLTVSACARNVQGSLAGICSKKQEARLKLL